MTEHPHPLPDILVVDDTPENLRLLTGMLKEHGYRVRPVPGGDLALRAARTRTPDLILLDIDMPPPNGFEVCRQLKEDPNLADVPVIFISALTDIDHKVNAFTVGGVDYVPKPFQFDEVRARITTHLELRRLQAELNSKNERLEQSLNEQRKLEQLRDNLVHMIVHDLRTPISAIQGFLQLLQFTAKSLVGKQRRYLDQAYRGCQGLNDMITALLDVSRLESTEMPVEACCFDVCTVIDDIIARLDVVNVDVELRQASPVQPLHLLADPGLTERILVNLTSNALKMTVAGHVTLRAYADDDMACLEVEDTGPGIPADSFDRIFEKFGQLELREESKRFSSGLGLTFCKLATEAQGGEIGVRSQVGHGSTFWFRLPLATSPAPNNPDSTQEGSQVALA